MDLYAKGSRALMVEGISERRAAKIWWGFCPYGDLLIVNGSYPIGMFAAYTSRQHIAKLPYLVSATEIY